MSETVGEAYVEVHADDAGLTAEVKAAAAEAAKAAKIRYEAEIRKSEVAAAAKKAAEAAKAKVRYDAELRAADVADAAKKAALLARARVRYEADVDRASVAEEAAAAAAAARAKVHYDADVAQAEVVAAAKIAAEAAGREATVPFTADADFGSMIVEAKAAARAAKSQVEFEVHLNRRGITRGADGIFRDLEGAAVSAQGAVAAVAESLGNIKPPAGGGAAASALDALAGAGARGGAGIAAVVAAIEILLPYAVAVGGGIIALAGQLAYASAQAIPLATNLGALGLAAGVTVIATQGLGDSFKAYGKLLEAQQSPLAKTKAGQEAIAKATDAYKASLDNVAPSAAEFVESITDLRKPFGDLRKYVQGNFFEGLGDSIKTTATAILPTLRDGLGETAGILNDAANKVLKFIRSSDGIDQIRSIFGGLNDILRPLLAGIGSFGRGFLTIFEGALGPGKDLADAIKRIGDNFADWSSDFVESGGLDRLLQRASDAGGDLYDILKNVGSILGSLFSGSNDTGQGLLDSIKEITKGFADMLKTPEGQAKMADFFQTVSEDLGGLADALRVGVPYFVQFVKMLQAGADDLNAFGDAIEPIAGPLGTVLGLLSGNVFTAGSSIFGPITEGLLGLDGIDWSKITSGLGGVFNAIGGAAGGAGSKAGGFFSGLVDSAKGLADKIISGAGDLVGAFTAWVQGVPDAVSGFFSGLVDSASGLASRIVSGAGDLAGAFVTWVQGVPGAISGFIDEVITSAQGLAQRIISAAGDLASAAGTWLAGLPEAAIGAVTDFIVNFNDLAGRIITAAGDIAGAVTQWLTDLPAAATYAVADLVGTFIGLSIRLFTEAGDAAAAFGTWVAGLPAAAAALATQIGSALAGLATRIFTAAGDAASAFATWASGLPAAAATLAAQIGGALAGLAGRLFSAAGSAASSFASWVSGLPGQAAALAGQLAGALAGLAGRMISAAGSLAGSFGQWVSGLPGRAQAIASQVASSFSGLARRMISAAGSLVSAVGTWASGVAAAGQRAAERLVSSFRGLASRIVAAIGTIIPNIGMPNISGVVSRIRAAIKSAATPTATGAVITSGPEYRLVGEAGPEAVVPLTPGARMSKDVQNLLSSVAAYQGFGGEPTPTGKAGVDIGGITVVSPSPDPEAVAMSVVNRLVMELAA